VKNIALRRLIDEYRVTHVCRSKLKSGYEEVFTVTDFYDGPRQGIANCDGQPRFYECISDETLVAEQRLFRLISISSQTFQLAMEDWDIWERWEAAFHAGRAGPDSHPALPEERERHEELKKILDVELRTNAETCIVRQGFFEAIGESSLPRGVLRPLQVRWIEAQNPNEKIR
jgi:hypothetical protein